MASNQVVTDNTSDPEKIVKTSSQTNTEDDNKGLGDESESVTSEQSSSGSVDYSDWDYVPDRSISYDSPRHYSNYHSQPYCSLRGVSYTPPGWIKKYRKRLRNKSDSEQDAGSEQEANSNPEVDTEENCTT